MFFVLIKDKRRPLVWGGLPSLSVRRKEMIFKSLKKSFLLTFEVYMSTTTWNTTFTVEIENKGTKVVMVLCTNETFYLLSFVTKVNIPTSNRVLLSMVLTSQPSCFLFFSTDPRWDAKLTRTALIIEELGLGDGAKAKKFVLLCIWCAPRIIFKLIAGPLTLLNMQDLVPDAGLVVLYIQFWLSTLRLLDVDTKSFLKNGVASWTAAVVRLSIISVKREYWYSQMAYGRPPRKPIKWDSYHQRWF